jgi:hypothetical protein
MDLARILAYVTGTVDQELLAQTNIWLPSRGPQGSRRGSSRRPAGYYPGLVPQAGRLQIRWLAGSSWPG